MVDVPSTYTIPNATDDAIIAPIICPVVPPVPEVIFVNCMLGTFARDKFNKVATVKVIFVFIKYRPLDGTVNTPVDKLKEPSLKHIDDAIVGLVVDQF